MVRISIYVHICVVKIYMKNMVRNYWDYLVNVDDFNKYPIPPIYNNKLNKIDLS